MQTPKILRKFTFIQLPGTLLRPSKKALVVEVGDFIVGQTDATLLGYYLGECEAYNLPQAKLKLKRDFPSFKVVA